MIADADHTDHSYRCWYPVGSPEYQEKRVQLETRRAEEISRLGQDDLTAADSTSTGVI